MEKLNFTFNEELFGALRKDWRTLASVEDAIEYFLNDDDVEEIRVSNGKGFDRHGDFQVLIDTRYANRDNKNDEYLILEIYDENSWRSFFLPIKHDKKLVLKKRGSVVYVGLE